MPLPPEDQAKFKSLYLQTARDYLKEMKGNFSQLLTGNKTDAVIDAIHIAAHSLKGQSAMMDYTSMVAVSTLIEDAFKKEKEEIKKWSNEFLQALNKAALEMEESMNEIDKNNKEKDLSSVVKDLQAFINE